MRHLGLTAILVFGLSCCSWGQWKDAELCACETDPDLVLKYCSMAINTGKLPAAELATTFYRLAYIYDAKGEYRRAIQDYGEAIRLNSNYADAFSNRCNAYYHIGEYDRAIQDCDEAIRLNPDHPFAFNNRGNSYKAKGEYDRAIKDYSETIRLNPNSVLGFKYRGAARFELGQFDAAVADFLQSANIEPNNPFAAIWVYLARSRAGQEARNALEKDAARFDLTTWPGHVLYLFLDRVNTGYVLAAPKNRDPKVLRELRCEAYFYVGEDALLRNSTEEARRYFQLAIDTGVIYFLEYHIAQAELNRLAMPNPPRLPTNK